MMDDGHFPYEVMILILLKLSVKSLTRFKCICKAWYALIKSSSFISTHLKSGNNEDARLVVWNFYHSYDPYSYPFQYALFLDKTLRDISYQVLNSQFPIHGDLFGPYDGLFVVYQIEYNRIYVWNIAMRETRALPECRFVVPHNTTLQYCYFGCGYDQLSNDYKLVFLRNFSPESGWDDFVDSCVSLYSFNNDSWRNLQVGELRRYSWFENSFNNSYLNGVCYWVAMRAMDFKEVIVSFDISSEVFQEINLPTYGLESEYSMLEVVNDTLCLLTTHNSHEEKISIWIMREGCWTKRFTTSDDFIGNGHVGFWKNDTIFIYKPSVCKNLILYDLNSQEAIDLGIPGAGTKVYKYNESLVSIRQETDFSEVFDIPWHVLGVI